MPQMMMDLLQYVPYALVIGAVFLLLAGGMLYTFLFFRNEGKRAERQAASFTKR